jgi:hypothetical protein
MNQADLFKNWQERVERCGKKLADARRIAGIPSPNFSNWRNGKKGMTLTSVARMEKAVVQIEQE